MGSSTVVVITNNYNKDGLHPNKFVKHLGTFEIHSFDAAKVILENGKPPITNLRVDGTNLNDKQIEEISRLLADCSLNTLNYVTLKNVNFGALTKSEFNNVLIVNFIGGSIKNEEHLKDIFPKTFKFTFDQTVVTCEAFRD